MPVRVPSSADAIVFPEDPEYVPWGMSCAIGLFGCDPDAIDNRLQVRDFLAVVVPAIGMVPFGEPTVERFGKGPLQGWTGFQLIETSAISVHCDPAGRRVFIDPFSCKPFDPRIVVDLALKCFGGVPRVATMPR